MSGLPGNPQQPRKPRPEGSAPRPTPPSDGLDEPSTFRPNPKKTTKTKPRASSGMPADANPGKGPTWSERIFFGSVSSGQLAAFCRQFAAYLSAGVDISKSLSGLQTQFARTALGPVIGRLLLGVRRGDSFAVSVAKEPQAFDPLFVGMIKVAEARGGIPETLKMLSRHYEARQSLIRQARSAMIYPIAVLSIASLVVALLTIFIIPMFAAMLKDIAGRGGGSELPLPSRVLMGVSDFVQWGGWFLIPAVMIGTPFVLFRMYKTAGGKRILDQVLMRIPVIGLLLRKIDTTRFARTLSALLGAGVDVGSSLDLTADVLRLEPFRRAIRDTRVQVMHGGEMSTAIDATGRFSPDVVAVMSSGEETGKLPESLEHLADDYEEQVAHMVKNMGQLIQPLLMVMLGGMVLFIILAVMLPYIAVISNLSAGS